MGTTLANGIDFSPITQNKREEPTHDVFLAYVFWCFGWMGAHRFFLGHQITGVIYLLTFGVLGIGWVLDAFHIPEMCRESSSFYVHGKKNYNITWMLFVVLGVFGVHRFYLGKWFTGLIYLFSGGLLGLGLLYDLFFLNEIINEKNKQ
jgi:TM2 domain-containing membrane protein YozV